MFVKFPFSSMRKRMGFVLKLSNGGLRLLEKGASEMVLSACTNFQDFNGSIHPLEGKLKTEIEDAIEKMAE